MAPSIRFLSAFSSETIAAIFKLVSFLVDWFGKTSSAGISCLRTVCSLTYSVALFQCLLVERKRRFLFMPDTRVLLDTDLPLKSRAAYPVFPNAYKPV